MNDIFNFSHCVEEFALQTICSNLDEYSDFFYIENGCGTKSVSQCSIDRFTHKRTR